MYIFFEKAVNTHISLSSLAETVDLFSFLECHGEKKGFASEWFIKSEQIQFSLMM